MKRHLYKHRIIENLYSMKEEEGFTLVELIVVVMIIGILSSIAIPSFMNAADKAKQQEAAALTSAYIKAVQAYYLTNSRPPLTDTDLSEFVSVLGCSKFVARGLRNPTACKTEPLVGPSGTRYWNSPSGLFNFDLGQKSGITYVLTQPAGDYGPYGYGVTGCFNHSSGNTKIVLLQSKGRWDEGANPIPSTDC